MTAPVVPEAVGESSVSASSVATALVAPDAVGTTNVAMELVAADEAVAATVSSARAASATAALSVAAAVGSMKGTMPEVAEVAPTALRLSSAMARVAAVALSVAVAAAVSRASAVVDAVALEVAVAVGAIAAGAVTATVALDVALELGASGGVVPTVTSTAVDEAASRLIATSSVMIGGSIGPGGPVVRSLVAAPAVDAANVRGAVVVSTTLALLAVSATGTTVVTGPPVTVAAALAVPLALTVSQPAGAPPVATGKYSQTSATSTVIAVTQRRVAPEVDGQVGVVADRGSSRVGDRERAIDQRRRQRRGLQVARAIDGTLVQRHP